MLARLPLDRSSHLRLLLAKNRRFCRRRRTNEAAFSSFVSPKILRLKRPFFGRLNCNCNRGRTTEERRPPTKTEGERVARLPNRDSDAAAAADDKTSICRHTYSTKEEREPLAAVRTSASATSPQFGSLAIKRALSLSLSLCRPSHIPVFFILSLSLFPLHRYRRPTND